VMGVDKHGFDYMKLMVLMKPYFKSFGDVVRYCKRNEDEILEDLMDLDTDNNVDNVVEDSVLTNVYVTESGERFSLDDTFLPVATDLTTAITDSFRRFCHDTTRPSVATDLIPVVTSFCGNMVECLEDRLELRVVMTGMDGKHLRASFKDATKKTVGDGYMFDMLLEDEVDLLTVPFQKLYNGHKNDLLFSAKDLCGIQVIIGGVQTSWRTGFDPVDENGDIQIHFPPDLVPDENVNVMHKANLRIDGELGLDAVEYIDISFGPVSSKKVREKLVLPTNRIRPFLSMREVYNEHLSTEYKDDLIKMEFHSITFRCEAISGIMKTLRQLELFKTKQGKQERVNKRRKLTN